MTKPRTNPLKLPTKAEGAATTGRRAKAYSEFCETNFTPTAEGSRSLVRSVSQRFPPITDPRNLLATLVKERQHTYTQIIGRIMSGWSLRSASIASGLSDNTVKGWLAKGLRDRTDSKDTYYARFASDVYSAVAYCVGDCEAEIALKSPIEYLTRGPGRAFYKDSQTWQPELDANNPVESELEPLEVVDDSIEPAPLVHTAVQALDVLRKQGLLDDEYAKQLAKQNNISVQPDTVQQPTSIQPSTDANTFTVQPDTTEQVDSSVPPSRL